MDCWKGPNSKIISATPGMDEYRQIHLAATKLGVWPALGDVETVIPAERRIDGIAEVHALRRAAHANKPRSIEDRA